MCPFIFRGIGSVLLTACASANCLLALKLYCQDLLKMRSVELVLKRQLFLRLILLNMHLLEFHFQTQNLREEKCFLITFVLVKLLAFAPLFNAPKKHVLNYFALEMAAIVFARMHRRERVVEGRGFPHILYYFECQKDTLSEHIICQDMLFFYLLQEIKDELEP